MNPKAIAILNFLSVASVSFAVIGWAPALITTLIVFALYVGWAVIG